MSGVLILVCFQPSHILDGDYSDTGRWTILTFLSFQAPKLGGMLVVLHFWCTAHIFLLFPNVAGRLGARDRGPAKFQAWMYQVWYKQPVFLTTIPIRPEISTCLPAVVVSWFFRPWWLAWNNLALNLHWRAMAACWMLVQRPNDGGIGKLLKSIYLSSVFTRFQHCSTCIELQMTFETWSKRKFSGSLLLRVDFLLSETYMKACHYAMVCGLQGSDAASAMQVLQRMEQMQLSANQVCFSTATRKQCEVIFHTDTDTRQRAWLNSL